MTTPNGTNEQVHDVVGVGFGPSNLALAIALAERAGPGGPSMAFVERQPQFGWHRGMLIEDARMQVSFLKDLATLRNPASPHTFLSYLHAHDRMSDFINCQNFFPTRLEFHDYLQWAARSFDGYVDYGTEVVSIVPDPDGVLRVRTRRPGGAEGVLLARTVVVATGLAPHLPPGVALDERVWHNRDLVPHVDALAGTSPTRFVVVGAGQSAAESVDYLHRRFPTAQVCAVFSRYGYTPADDSGFANRVFDPAGVDDFFGAPDAVKDRMLGYHRNTNYSVVDPDLIRSLYDRHYAERVDGAERLRFLKGSSLLDAARHDGGVTVTVGSDLDGHREVLEADAIVYATGYRSGDPTRFLGGAPVSRDALGRVAITRDYRLVPADDPDGPLAGVYVQGATEHTHGIASTLLSNVAVRAGEIAASIAARLEARRTADRSVLSGRSA